MLVKSGAAGFAGFAGSLSAPRVWRAGPEAADDRIAAPRRPRAVIAERSCSLKDLTVLAAKNDPFRVDTTARHRDGRWLAGTAVELGLGTWKIHLRGLHYRI